MLVVLLVFVSNYPRGFGRLHFLRKGFTGCINTGLIETYRDIWKQVVKQLHRSHKPIQHYWEAINHAKAFRWVLEALKTKVVINESFILKLHKFLLDGIDSINGGFYRSVCVRILGSRTILPNPLKVPDLMQSFCLWLTENNMPPLEKAFEAHYRLVTIHHQLYRELYLQDHFLEQ